MSSLVTVTCILFVAFYLIQTVLSSAGKCPPPVPVTLASPNVEPWQDEFPVGTQVQFTCESGTYMDGDNAIYCVEENSEYSWTRVNFACLPPSTKPKEDPGVFRRFRNWIECKFRPSKCPS